ncbi:MAG: sialidase family protein [Candidatus Borkfalkiaceae bacterium]|nr:sialidase family protein [Clostridia bacterium]MDY6223849.1 sialidase family protein [Christensenellaceae bacterium]
MKKLFASILAGALLLSAGVFSGKQSGVQAQEITTQAEEMKVIGFWSSEAGVKERKVSSNSDETYAEESRRWQGLPTIAVTEGGRMWCAWQTGDSVEGPDGVDNYDVMYYSDDSGVTWSEEYMIWDVPDENIRLTDPRLFTDQFGKLWLILIRGGLKGVYAMQILNPDCENPETELRFSSPVSWLKLPPAHRPTILSNGRWITPVENSTAKQVTYICNPDNANGKYSWTTNTTQPAVSAFAADKKYGEAQILELADTKTLMMLSRLPADKGGGMEVSYSSDYGVTWSAYEADKGVPYVTPSSKFHIQRLNSGAVLMLTHASTSQRVNLAAYLSYDDGKTFPYMLMLDDSETGNRWGVSYPEAAQRQGKNGEIYIAYDAGRYDQKEIRMCVITEEDIKAGKPVSASCKMRMKVSATGGYLDYVSVKEKYERYINVKTGTPKSEILSLLPQTVTLVGEDGSELPLQGEWQCPDYSKNETGRYTFTFSRSVNGKAQDRYSLLKAYVTVRDESIKEDNEGENNKGTEDGKESGCRSSVVGGGGVLIAAVAGSLMLCKKRRR